ncbi:MAG: glycosyltransferase family 2 protein [Candidatus Berkelbacteria bacterium]|nr:glycosyltransferase family 2 protein [Candidatus Berkelbacteria bacterium]
MARNMTLIVIPTYNERENLTRLLSAIKKQNIGADVLVVDDNSPDGTGKIARKISQKEKRVGVLHRKKKEGLGKAYVAGFKWGMKKGYEKLISMDADFSHPVEALRRMIKLCSADTVVTGSRYVKGGKIVGWSWDRYVNSSTANLITRLLLSIKTKDATAGFKCYPVEFFEKISLDKIRASGYAFQVEMIMLAQDNGFKSVETPITFVDRKAGESKIQGELVKSAKLVFSLAAEREATRQFVKFCIVGAINTLVDWLFFFLARTSLTAALGTRNLQTLKQIAKAISFIISATSSYIMNRKWTFRSTNPRVARELIQFFIVATGGLIINSLVFYLITAQVGWRDIFGLVIATAAATLWNFVLNKKWTFKNRTRLTLE